jgi:hypothetical protein
MMNKTSLFVLVLLTMAGGEFANADAPPVTADNCVPQPECRARYTELVPAEKHDGLKTLDAEMKLDMKPTDRFTLP